MKSFPCCRVLFALIIALGAVGITGCGDGSTPAAPSEAKAAAGILGKYENANDKLLIDFKADKKATLTDEGKATDLTWEMDGAQKVVIHGKEGFNLVLTINSEGNLSDGMGGVFRKK